MEQAGISDTRGAQIDRSEDTKSTKDSIHHSIERIHQEDLQESLAGIVPTENIAVNPIYNLAEAQELIDPGGIALVDIDGVLTGSILAGLPIVRRLQPNFLFEPESIGFLKALNQQQEACAIVTNRHPGATAQRVFNSRQLLRALQIEMTQEDLQIPIFRDLQRAFPTYGDPRNYTILRRFLHDNIARLSRQHTPPTLYHIYDTSLIRSRIPLMRRIFSEGRFLRYALNENDHDIDLKDLHIKALPIIRNL
jgi:hypothetical protein